MNNLLHKLWLLTQSNHSKESFIEVANILTSLRDSGSGLSVLFDGADSSFDSRILAVNARHRVVIIDSSPEEAPPALLKQGRQLTLSTSSQGRKISLRSKFIEPFMQDTNLGYQIEMPHFLGLEKPRAAFRVLLDELRVKVGITLMDASDHHIDGIVNNISKTGVGMRTKNSLANFPKDSNDTVDCLISLQDSEEISCKMEICNVREQRNGDSETYIGGRILDINKADSNLLTEFIEHLQNQQLKELTSSA